MLTRWMLENFKPICGRIDLPLAPLTVLAGLNSSGKSSFLQSILLISQTLANQNHDEPIVLNGTILRLGTFADVLNEHATEPRIGIGFTLNDEQGSPIEVNIRFEALNTGKQATSALEGARVRLTGAELSLGSAQVTMRPATHEEENAFLSSPRRAGRVFPVDENYISRVRTSNEEPGDEQFFTPLWHFLPSRYKQRVDSTRIASITKWYRSAYPPIDQAIQQIIGAFGSAVRYVGPLRAAPDAIQDFSPSGQLDDVGPRGQYAAAVYAANRNQTIEYPHPDTANIERGTLEEAMGIWLRHLGIAASVNTREAAAPGVTWLIRPTPDTKDRPLHAVGVGVSQVLPILVAGLLSAPGTILIIEQPELHLHERPQGRLSDFFLGLTRIGKQVLVETHSAVFINQLRYRMVKEGQPVRDAIAIYFVEQDERGDTHAHPIEISPRGAIQNWPDGFFDESFRQEDRITQSGIAARGVRKNA